MASLNNRVALNDSDQGSRSIPFSLDGRRAKLLTVRLASSIFSPLTGAVRALRQRERDRVELAKMSPYELHDIRVSSSDRWAEISKPFWRK